MKRLPYLILALSCLPLTAHADEVKKFTPRELMRWDHYGKGKAVINHGQLLISEDTESLGYMLVSPKAYQGDVIFSYEVMPLRAATILIVEFLASNHDVNTLSFPDEYEGDVKYMFKNLDMYMVCFHNAAHNKHGPFIRKFPKPGAVPLVASTKHYFELGKYTSVEIGKTGNTIWMAVNGERLLETEDKKVLQEGKMIIRIRGTSHETASCLIRNVQIQEMD
jgi:hypothetical protein